MIVPGYIAEIAPSKWRGVSPPCSSWPSRWASSRPCSRTHPLRALLVGPARSSGGTSAWRWMLLVGVVPAVVYGVLALIIPESPQFLIRAGRDEEAAWVLAGRRSPRHLGQDRSNP